MKASLIFFVIAGSISLGLVGWFLFAGSSEDTHLSHREYIPPVTPTEPDELDNLSSVLGQETSDQFREVSRTIYQDVYAIYSCRNEPDSQALLLTAQYQQSAAGNNFAHAIAAVRAWEPVILQDIGTVLYLNLPADALSTATTLFSDVPQRSYRAAVTTVGAENVSVYYGWLLNYVIFAPSQACLEQTMNNVYEVGA